MASTALKCVQKVLSASIAHRFYIRHILPVDSMVSALLRSVVSSLTYVASHVCMICSVERRQQHKNQHEYIEPFLVHRPLKEEQ